MRDAALFSAMGVAPQFLTRTVEGATGSIEGFKDDRVLVVVQLGGGNDGLNTVVPYENDLYHNARPQIGLRKDRVLPINEELGFNDRLRGLMGLYDEGRLAVIQGVGYPNPDRSHFRSMDIWHTASESDEYLNSGWMGRYFDRYCSGSARPQVGAAIGNERPLAFEGQKGLGLAFEDPRRFGWDAGSNRDTVASFSALNASGGGGDTTLDFLRHVTSNAIMSAEEIRAAADRGHWQRPAGNYFERALATVAAMVRGELATRIFFVSATGFDTHANQAGQHDNLLAVVGDGLAKFQEILRNDGTSGRVSTMVFSEFGRRVSENNSRGTDHGTAAPMFLIGDAVKPGLHGFAPDLGDLLEGDLKHTTDFRAVYASVLREWFRVDAAPVLGSQFDGLSLFV